MSNYFQTHGVAIGTKKAVSFANIYLAEIKTNLIQQSNTKPREWTFSPFETVTEKMWNYLLKKLTISILQQSSRPKYQRSKGERFTEKSILDIKTHYEPTETFQHTHFTSCHPSGVKRGFIKGDVIRLLRINSSKATFHESLANFKQRLQARGYLKQDIERSLQWSEVNFDQRQSVQKQN